MEEIVQLRKREYKKLIEQADNNKEEIERKAREMYEEHGTVAIRLKCNIAEWDEELTVKADAYIEDWDNKFPLSTIDKKKIIKFVNQRSEELFEKRFSDAIYEIKALRNAKQAFIHRKKMFTALTITGWGVALLMLIMHIYL